MNTLFPPESFDWVVCNPPYGKLATGRVNPQDEQAVCRHEIEADLADIIRAISYSLKNRGRTALIYPANRAAVLLAGLKAAALEPKRLQIIHSYPGSQGKLVLIEAMKNGGEELVILPPFFIYEEAGGKYSAAMARLYEPIPIIFGEMIVKTSMMLILPALFFGLETAALADDDDRRFGGKRWWSEERNEEYQDGPCKVKIEAKGGEFKREIKCKDGIGANWSGEWKREFWDGPCKVKQEAKHDEFKEEVKCK